jgi:peptide/nickel transport system substrate-binding protein
MNLRSRAGSPGQRAVTIGSSPQQHRSRSRRARILAVGAVTAALALAAAGCSSGSSTPASSSGAPVNGGTAVFAEPPATTPSYIFPYISSTFSSDVNTFDFEYLLYRPLFWIGTGADPTQLNTSISLANPPAFNGRTVTITLKHYMWSNGTQVTAQNVMFWLNMETALPADYASYTTFPADVSNIKVVSPTELTMTMDKGYNPQWFTMNQLTQITPMPTAWDRTASGPSHCETTVGDCAAVYNYLNTQAKNVSGYVGSAIWSVVDGPWKLSAFNADGHVTFVPNKSYSGPVKPRLAAFEEVPFTTDSAEFDVLQSPSSSTKIDYGYIPWQDVPPKPASATVGPNPLASKGYTLYPWPTWGINYSVMNFQSSIGDHAAIIKQLYFRQALAYLMNQAAVLAGPLRGYGNITVGPVGSDPVTPYLSAQGKSGDPFPYNPAKAKSLLASHGWKVVPSGTSTCVKPGTAAGDCGAGITAGSALSFNLPYATGTAWIASELQQLQSNAATIGIKLNLQPKPFNEVIALAGGNCVVVKLPCDWDLADWGGGWSFSPDYLPTGEQLFFSGAAANSGGYSNATNDSLINTTLTNSNPQVMFNWEDYLAKQLPVLWQPNANYQLNEIANNLKGATPLSPTLAINPENWYFVK